MTEVAANGVDTREGFVFPSYVEHIMGPLCFDLGFGPFRWVCTSGRPEDLHATDQAAMSCIDPTRRGQDRDNYIWIRDAESNRAGGRLRRPASSTPTPRAACASPCASTSWCAGARSAR